LARLKTLRLSAVTWMPREVRIGNDFDGTWRKDAPSNNVRGRPFGGTGEGVATRRTSGDDGTAEWEGKASKGGCARGDDF